MSNLIVNVKKTLKRMLGSRHLILIVSITFPIVLAVALYLVYCNPVVIGTMIAIIAAFAGVYVFIVLTVIYQRRLSRSLENKVRKVEADLHETEQLYRRVVDQATDLIYILDLEGKVVLLNQHCASVFYELASSENPVNPAIIENDFIDISQYQGKMLVDIVPARDWEFVHDRMVQVLKDRLSISYEHTVALQNRKIRFSTKLIPITDDKGGIYNILGITRDITENSEFEQRIYQTEKLASIGTLAAGVAHEINNPLSIILGFTDLMLEKHEPDSPEYKDLEVIMHNGLAAKKVVENLLGFARVTRTRRDSVKVRSCIEKVVNTVQHLLKTNKLKLEIDISDHLPLVVGDPGEFQQVILNLLNNAVAAMADQSGTLRISAVYSDGWVNISVSDEGVGIPDSVKPKIFDPFFTTKPEGEGTGLGLSLCYGIVNKYNGNITFSSSSCEDNPDHPNGTTFTVSLPEIKPEANPDDR